MIYLPKKSLELFIIFVSWKNLDGPIWLDKLNDSDFVQKTIDYMKSKEFDLPLATNKKILGILHSI